MSFWDDQQNNSYRGIPAEVQGEPVPEPQFPPSFYNTVGQSAPVPVQMPVIIGGYQQLEGLVQTEEDEVYYNNLVLNDARLRLVQGSLYEKIMNHNLFEGYDADPIAIKNVEREIKKYARERMEIMLGMRQEKSAQVSAVQLTEAEVQFFKTIYANATAGKSSSPELNRVVSNAPQKLNSIGSAPAQNLPPMAKPQASAPRPQPQQAPQAEAVPEQAGPPKLLQEMTEEERAAYLEKNRQKYARAQTPAGGMPMPSGLSEQMGYAAMSQSTGGLNNAQATMMRHIVSTNR
jgi:hypothetical protein